MLSRYAITFRVANSSAREDLTRPLDTWQRYLHVVRNRALRVVVDPACVASLLKFLVKANGNRIFLEEYFKPFHHTEIPNLYSLYVSERKRFIGIF